MVDVVEIMLTDDRFEAEIITEAVRSKGFKVELIQEDSGTAIGMPGHPSRLLVLAADADQVRAIIEGSPQDD